MLFVMSESVINSFIYVLCVVSENAMVIHFRFIKAIVTTEEGFLLDPSCHEVIPLVQKLQQQLQPSDVLFEFQVLGIALEVVSNYLDSNVADLERAAYPVLDELPRMIVWIITNVL